MVENMKKSSWEQKREKMNSASGFWSPTSLNNVHYFDKNAAEEVKRTRFRKNEAFYLQHYCFLILCSLAFSH